MSNLMKVIIVLLLAIGIGAVVIAKRQPSAPTETARPTTAASGGAPCCTFNPGAPATAPATKPSSALPRLVDLGAGTCIPCRKMAPILEELKTELAGQVQVEFIDVRQNPDAGEKYGIKLIPTQIFYDAAGKELSRHEGFMPREDILARLKEHGINFRAAH